jgi:hypothetical protein
VMAIAPPNAALIHPMPQRHSSTRCRSGIHPPDAARCRNRAAGTLIAQEPN